MTCTRDIRNSKNVVPPSSEAWEAYSYSSSFIFLAKHPIKANRVAGKTFYIYNPERVILNMTKAQFLADPGTAIKNAISLPATYPPNPRARFLFNMSQLLAEPVDVQRSTINNLKSSILNRFLCSTDSVGAPYCHVNNLAYTYYP